MSFDFVDPFTRSEIDLRRARLAADWRAAESARRGRRAESRRDEIGPGADIAESMANSANPKEPSQPLFETAETY